MRGDDWLERSPIRTPLSRLTMVSPGSAYLLGWMLFFLFLIALVFLCLGLVSVLKSGYSRDIRTILLCLFGFAMYSCVSLMFLIETFSSIDSSLIKAVSLLKRIEETAYSHYKIVSQGELEKQAEKKSEKVR